MQIIILLAIGGVGFICLSYIQTDEWTDGPTLFEIHRHSDFNVIAITLHGCLNKPDRQQNNMSPQ